MTIEEFEEQERLEREWEEETNEQARKNFEDLKILLANGGINVSLK